MFWSYKCFLSDFSIMTDDIVLFTEVMDDERIVRQCASNPYNPDKPCYKKSGMGGTVRVCDCEGDKCNEASRIELTVLLTTVFLLLVWLAIIKLT